jgi:hypothetical protein
MNYILNIMQLFASYHQPHTAQDNKIEMNINNVFRVMLHHS